MFPIRDTIPSRTTPVVTWLIIIVNAGVFLLELGFSGDQLTKLFYLFGLVPATYSNPRWAFSHGFPVQSFWPFLTSMFLHGSWMHIISNMWILSIFGDNVEDRMGHFRFLLFYILCGIVSAGVHLITNLNSSIPTVGASGAIAGVMGAYFLLYPYARILTLVPIFFYPLFIEVPAVLFLGIWFYIQFFSGVMSLSQHSQVGGIAWWVHIGGFIAGAMLSVVFVKRRDA